MFEAAVTVALSGDVEQALKVLHSKLSKEDFLISLGTNEQIEEMPDSEDPAPSLALASDDSASKELPDSPLDVFNRELVEHLKKRNFSHLTIEKDGLEITGETRKRPIELAQSIIEVVEKSDADAKKEEQVEAENKGEC